MGIANERIVKVKIDGSRHRSLPEILTLYGELIAAQRQQRQAQNADLIAAAGKNRVTSELRQIDGAVRAHEHTHLTLAGPYAQSAASYITIRGPDGRSYAVGGSVKVDLQPVPGDPDATIRKARAIIRAAFGPHAPSGADMRVAAKAYRMERMARQDKEQEAAASAQQLDIPV